MSRTFAFHMNREMNMRYYSFYSAFSTNACFGRGQ